MPVGSAALSRLPTGSYVYVVVTEAGPVVADAALLYEELGDRLVLPSFRKELVGPG